MILATLLQAPAVPDVPWYDRSGVSAAIALLALAVSAGAALWSRRDSRRAEAAIVHELRDGWKRLAADWQIAILLVRGPSDYYSGGTPEQRSMLVRYYEVLVEPSRLLGDSALAEEELVLRTALESSVRRVFDFLDWATVQVLTNRITPSQLYSLLGNDIVRRGSVLRGLIDRDVEPTIPGGLQQSFDDAAGSGLVWLPKSRGWASFLEYYPSEGQRVLVLLDLMWAEAIRFGNVNYEEAERVAETKRRLSTGRRNRRRCRVEARRFRGPIASWRLGRRLSIAEWLPPRGEQLHWSLHAETLRSPRWHPLNYLKRQWVTRPRLGRVTQPAPSSAGD